MARKEKGPMEGEELGQKGRKGFQKGRGFQWKLFFGREEPLKGIPKGGKGPELFVNRLWEAFNFLAGVG